MQNPEHRDGPPTSDNQAADNAWHRQPTIWVVLGILGFTVVSSFALLYVAAKNPPELIDRTPAELSGEQRSEPGAGN